MKSDDFNVGETRVSNVAFGQIVLSDVVEQADMEALHVCICPKHISAVLRMGDRPVVLRRLASGGEGRTISAKSLRLSAIKQ